MKCTMTMALAALVAVAAPACRAETGANIGIDGRGLLHVGEILKDNPKANYGFVNFVAFGPGWQYTAQDYAAKEHKKGTVDDQKYGRGLLFTGKIWAGGSGLAIYEEFFDISKGGPAKAHVRWKISSLNGKPMGLERAYIRFPLSLGVNQAGDTVFAFSIGNAAKGTRYRVYRAASLTEPFVPWGDVVEATVDGVLDFAVETGDAPAGFFKIVAE